jgi:hypothetical protein
MNTVLSEMKKWNTKYLRNLENHRSHFSHADFYTPKIEAIRSSETSIYRISTRRYIPEDCILHSHRRENHKSYKTYIPSFRLHVTHGCWRSCRTGTALVDRFIRIANVQ